MLSPNFMVDLSMPQRRRSRMGIWLISDDASALRDCSVQCLSVQCLPGQCLPGQCWPGGLAAVPALAEALPETALTFARPRSQVKASLFGNGAQVAAAAKFASQQQPTSNVSYAHKTRIAATGGGRMGPQPPRDPV